MTNVLSGEVICTKLTMYMYCPVKKVALIKELTEMVCQFNNNKRVGILI